MIFIANRLSNGNLLFPTEIHIFNEGINIIKPGLVSSIETSVSYKFVTNVTIHSPLFGFSKVIIQTLGKEGTIVADGFERAEAQEIKKIIINKLKH